MRLFRDRTFLAICKWTVYALLLIVAYLMQTVRGLSIPILEAKPLVIYAVFLTVVFLEGGAGGMVFAFCSGVLMDHACGSKLGYFALGFVVVAFLIVTLTRIFMLPNFYTFLLYGGVSLVVLMHTDFLFRFALFAIPGTDALYLNRFLPSMVYTLVVLYLTYFPVRWISKGLRAKDEATEVQ